MFKIYDGRDRFYQWDLDRKLIVEDASITEVHFCNKTDDCSLVCATYKEGNKTVVNVPNILLQDNWAINVYGYTSNYTKFSERFEVERRTRPADYVYTETEVKTWEDLSERIEALEQGGGGGTVIEGVKEIHVGQYKPTDENIIVWINPDAEGEEYAKKSDVPDVSGFALKTDIPATPNLEPYALKTDIPDVSGFAKQSDIPDLSDYAKKSDIPAAPDLSGYALKSELPNLAPYALKTELPDVSGFTTMAAVEAKEYQTAAQVNALITTALGVIENGTY